ncbi:hypothetical protein B9Z19DRAFT_1123180 [Tuber borchii]|uniref:Uncharacterized protein n=1 Tax=Tuber borchii TaxID=42251 RepID=A0A2T6ZYZ1_TUBBO|nr:hypothetical protein B9Z19DRAFT_1123180 [Tuber borchii]
MRYLLALVLGTLVVGDPQVPSGAVTLAPPPVSLGSGLFSMLSTSSFAPLAAASAPDSVQDPATPQGAPRQKRAPQVSVSGPVILPNGAPYPPTSVSVEPITLTSAIPVPSTTPAPTLVPSAADSHSPPLPSGVVVSIAPGPSGASIPVIAGPHGPTPVSIIVGPSGRPMIADPAGPTPISQIIGPNGLISIPASAGGALPTRPPSTPALPIPSPWASATVPPAALNSSSTIPTPASSTPPAATLPPSASYYTIVEY